MSADPIDMLEDEERRSSTRMLLDAAHKISTAIMLVVILWAGNTINETQKKVIELSTQVQFMAKALEKSQTVDYTVTDALKDLTLRDSKITQLEKRVELLERSTRSSYRAE